MISTCINRTTGLVTHTGTGDLSAAEITKAVEARLESSDFRPGMSVLWDCRGATISSLSIEDIQELTEIGEEQVVARGGGTVVIVAPEDVDYGLGRMIQTNAQDLPWRIGVFRDLDSALEWLRSPE